MPPGSSERLDGPRAHLDGEALVVDVQDVDRGGGSEAGRVEIRFELEAASPDVGAMGPEELVDVGTVDGQSSRRAAADAERLDTESAETQHRQRVAHGALQHRGYD